ncbi:von Willebrand factor type A domain-containing protein [Epilithonimonas sp. UC225_85]|uniref:vWA domain-containing protein n=1 Tax=Epilithonimonas sp. UC225_85 TaxID=3350167 RepID=UPI0036D3A252
MENQDIDKMFNDAGKSAEENPTFPTFEKVWEKVEEKLDKKEQKKRIIPLLLPYGIAAGLALTFGVLYFMNDEKGKIEPQISQNNTWNSSSKFQNDSEKIQKLDKEIKENILATPIEKPKEIIAYHEAPTMSVVSPQAVTLNNSVLTSGYNNIRKEETQNSVKTQTRKKIDTSMATQEIEGVVVTAMGIKREQKSLSYASMTVSSEKFKKKSNKNALDALQGRVAGLEISQDQSANPANISIRGSKNVSSENQPMVVIDGKSYDGEILSTLNVNKIQNVKILKDASATALYGSKAVNGAIIIESKNLSKRELRKIERAIKKSSYYKHIKEADNEEYDEWKENKFELAKSEPLSTFSIDVDNAAYSNIRRMINNGQQVDKNAVRIEEMINYFKYNYPQPKNGQPFSINTEYNDCAWNSKHKILKIGLQGKTLNEKELPASNLVFLIDVSGSMNEQNKLPLLKSSFKILLEKLRPQDKVALVTYAGSAGVVLEPTSAKEKDKILNALENLSAGGSTAGGEGIELAYKLAQENLVKNGNNRVILATDGDFNVGVSDNSELQKLIEQKRQSGIFLTCLGFGMGNYKDNRLEMLADKGNGNYAYIDNMQESNKFLGKEFAGSMYAIAKDVKIQIEFNPKFVKSYRLIGYENRKLNNEDFKNDKIDAGELGIGHTVTAIYEIIPTGSDSEFSPKDIDLKYSKSQSQNEFGDELATVKFRYKNPDEDVSKELIQTIKDSKNQLNNASSDFKFASSVAWFGLVLRQSEFIKDKDLDKIINLAKQGKSNDEDGYRSEFIRLIESYKQIK